MESLTLIKPRTVHILTQWYEPEQASRLEEMRSALQLNCENPFIQKIFLLNERMYERLPIQNEKIIQVHLGRRLTLGDAYRFAAQYGKETEAWCLTNADIVLDESLSQLRFSQLNEVHCLTRYERVNGTWEIFQGPYMNGLFNGPRSDSQDSWLFLTPTRPLKPDSFTGLSADHIEIGRLACDNKAALILHESGLSCKNSSKTIKTYHYHFQRDYQSDYTRQSHRYPPPYLFLEPVEIHELSKMTLCTQVMITVPMTPNDRLDSLQLNASFKRTQASKAATASDFT